MREFGTADSLDLSRVIIVTPGSRPGRRMLELFAVAAGRMSFMPPRFLTAGNLPEALYQPRKPMASDLVSVLAWREALVKIKPKELRLVFPDLPDKSDLQGWCDIAREVLSIHATLAADSVSFSEVARRLKQSLPDFDDEGRWHVLETIHDACMRLLDREDRADQHAARREALRTGDCQSEQDIFLVGCPDLNRTTRLMLALAAEHGTVSALVHAPDSLAAGFDTFGCIEPEFWRERMIDFEKSVFGVASVRFADRPRDEAVAVLEELADETSLGADEITIGVGDDTFALECERVLVEAGVPVRIAAGTPIDRSRPVLFLRALARFVATDGVGEFEQLVRHPDCEALIQAELDCHGIDDKDRWLAALDDYFGATLLPTMPKSVPGSLSRTVTAVQRVIALFRPGNPAARTLAEWSPVIADCLRRLYGGRSISTHTEDGARLAASLELIAGMLQEQSTLHAHADLLPRMTFPGAIDFTLARVEGESLPSAGGTPAVELLGWLELALDDAPRLIVTCVNEGVIPGGRDNDAFLPDAARRALGMADSSRRFARDLYLTAAILQSRRSTWIATRRDANDVPLAPSRLLLACSDDLLVSRLRNFYDPAADGAGDSRPRAPIRWLEPGVKPSSTGSGFLIPAPPSPGTCPVLTDLRVTAFRDYIACPYRFYLKHILHLREFNEAALELDPLRYGSLIHRALQYFAESAARDSQDEKNIRREMREGLDRAMGEELGEMSTAVAIQKEFLGNRLDRLAGVQARLVAGGWRIVHVEKRLEATMEVDGEPFLVHGTIDRIDRHESGAFRLIDYKSYDSAKTPEKTHRSGRKEWIDLQLPLYLNLAAQLGVSADSELGYVLLPRDPARIDFEPAKWTADDIASALEKAHDVIRGIRAGLFWPPASPEDLAWPDAFSVLCMDEYIARPRVISAVTSKWNARPS